jgi:DNA-binding MarR family transcriptional regulator
MFQYEDIYDLFFNKLKKLLYPEEWISLDLDFSKSELFTMLLVDRNGEIIMSKIADYVNVSMSTANGIVERLIKKGLLSRDRSDSDRRIVVIRLTEEGKNLVNELKKVVLEYIGLIFEALDDEERKLIFKIFNKITDIIDSKAKKSTGDDPANTLRKIDIE